MSERVRILVATMSGNAEIAADEMVATLNDAGVEAEMVQMNGLDASVFEPDTLYIICTSTYGQGDVPDNGQALYKSLLEKSARLDGVRYGVFGLGDRTYRDTFNHGGQRFDEALVACGATRLGEIYRHDAASGTLAEDDAIEWVQAWLEAARAATAEA